MLPKDKNKLRSSIIARLRPPATLQTEQPGPMDPVEDPEEVDGAVEPPEDIDSIINAIPDSKQKPLKKKRII